MANGIQFAKRSFTQWSILPSRIKLAYFGAFIGLAGMYYCFMRLPGIDAPVMQVSKWAATNMLVTIVTLSSIVGIASRRITSFHLKVIDLLWVSASAIGVVFAIIQLFVVSADESRARIERQWSESRNDAIQLLKLAANEECNEQQPTEAKGCGRLAVLITALSSHGIIDASLLNAACPPFPIDLSVALPSGYSHTRVYGCMKANTVAYVLQLPVMLDKKDTEDWSQRTRTWPLLLMFFVALRVSKGVAEVFWKIKQ
ncbi:MAG: hypothetical protein Q7K26_06160 [bacterium]|nr:hypothetical protein [bacterium]